jgi:UDP-N-acetylmuramoyl-L-alanyl-D-glutamate--2,6-diaminopimelate ligase
VTAEDIRLHPQGSSFVACTPWGCFTIESRLIGRHNVSNILAATAVALSQGVDIFTVQRAVRCTCTVPGRLEFVPNDKGYSVVVDYAHTDDALRNVLISLREITGGRLIVVFGCGGDRDRGKRKKMGGVARQLADYAVVTSDNPRSEDPLEIISEIIQGFHGGNGNFTVEADRTRAIATAIGMAEKGDTVLIAGKGHETYQEFKDHRIHFDDREVARELIA